MTLGIVAAAWLALPVVVKSFLKASFYEFTSPASVAASHLRDLQEYWSLRLHTRSELIEAGHDLAQANASFALAIQQNAELHAEVASLEQVLHMPAVPDFRLEPARVVQRDFSTWWQRLVIRKGRDAGIPVGAAVVWAEGAVGRVTEVHAYTSVVELISNPGVRLAAIISGGTEPVSFQGGDNPSFGPARGTVEFVPLDVIASPASPQQLVTSGLGGVFPPGLAIGKVVRVAPSADGLFKTGEVELDPRLSDLTEVSVLVPVKMAGQ
jgi:rod shape-determining protein MreC